MEKFSQVNSNQSLQRILEAWLTMSRQSIAISKPEVAQLLKFAQSDRERDTIRYALYKASGLTPTGARRELGLPESMNSKNKECIEQCMKIHKELDQIISTRLKFTVNMYDSDSYSGEELDSDMDTHSSSKGTDSLKVKLHNSVLL